ncbi:barrier-to-autointegration factor-like [Sorex araneus]|uniref:barrier-to-autointegration factor-like n=1 Tax=Sorex araneus TaxID=42254 RepID=UPI002433AE83|nr:barrier-to-autointegration factor-like [Sorex araneus]
MTTSQKHRDFVAEPMGEKPVGSLAGIGEVLGKKLEERGFDKAFVVLGRFLVLKKDEDLSWEWLEDTRGANAKQSRDCFGCLREWCEAFLSCSWETRDWNPRPQGTPGLREILNDEGGISALLRLRPLLDDATQS